MTRLLGIGLADAVITRLANTRSLRVLPTAAVIEYVDATDPQGAGQELSAANVVVGMLHRREGGYRITVQLLQTADGALVWGDTFDVESVKLLGIEESVSVRVAEALRAEFTERARTRSRTPRNPAAYEPYLQARGLLDIASEVPHARRDRAASSVPSSWILTTPWRTPASQLRWRGSACGMPTRKTRSNGDVRPRSRRITR